MSASRPNASVPLRRRLAASLVLLGLLATVSPAQADEYDEDRAGHPLRIIAYVVHPVGVLLDYLVMRPAHWLASHEPLRTLVGHDEE